MFSYLCIYQNLIFLVLYVNEKHLVILRIKLCETKIIYFHLDKELKKSDLTDLIK